MGVYGLRKRDLPENRWAGGVHQNFSTLVTPQGQHGTTTPGTPQHTSIIIIGVVVPLVLIAIAGFVVYICYRRRYPVRMIVGKDFNHFTNPKFDKRASTITLVRHIEEDSADARESSDYTHQELSFVSETETENGITQNEHSVNVGGSQTNDVRKLSSHEGSSEVTSTARNIVRERPRPKKAVLVRSEEFDEFSDGFEMVTESDLDKRTDSELSSGNDSVDTRTVSISFKETFSGSSGSLDFVSEHQDALQDGSESQSIPAYIDETDANTADIENNQSTPTGSVSSVESPEIQTEEDNQLSKTNAELISNNHASVDNQPLQRANGVHSDKSSVPGNYSVVVEKNGSETIDNSLKQDRGDSMFIENTESGNNSGKYNNHLHNLTSQANTNTTEEIIIPMPLDEDSNVQQGHFNKPNSIFIQTSNSANLKSTATVEINDNHYPGAGEISNEQLFEQDHKADINSDIVKYEHELESTTHSDIDDEYFGESMKSESDANIVTDMTVDHIHSQTEAYCIQVEEPRINIVSNRYDDDKQAILELLSESATTDPIDPLITADGTKHNTIRPTLNLSTETVYLDNAPPTPMVIVQDSIIYEPYSGSPIVLNADDNKSVGHRMSFDGFESMSSSIGSDRMITGVAKETDTPSTEFECAEITDNIHLIEFKNTNDKQISSEHSEFGTDSFDYQQRHSDSILLETADTAILTKSDKDNGREQIKLHYSEATKNSSSPDFVFNDIEIERKGEIENTTQALFSESTDVLRDSEIENYIIGERETGVEKTQTCKPSSLNISDDSNSTQSSMELSIDHYSNSFIKASTPTPSSAEDKAMTMYSFEDLLPDPMRHIEHIESTSSVSHETPIYERANDTPRENDSVSPVIEPIANPSNVHDVLNISERSASVDSSGLSWEFVSENISLNSDNTQDADILETDPPKDNCGMGLLLPLTADENVHTTTDGNIVMDDNNKHTDEVADSPTAFNVCESHEASGTSNVDADLSWDLIDDDSSC